uniref:Uncharacterized protein n=1 Tax=Physcomitrium patens TaxID=3218 RepID=A0A2K1IFI0_PHYPA|nr:hypothetical protein PHYPA_028616 [Physcomitrium patens]
MFITTSRSFLPNWERHQSKKEDNTDEGSGKLALVVLNSGDASTSLLPNKHSECTKRQPNELKQLLTINAKRRKKNEFKIDFITSIAPRTNPTDFS